MIYLYAAIVTVAGLAASLICLLTGRPWWAALMLVLTYTWVEHKDREAKP